MRYVYRIRTLVVYCYGTHSSLRNVYGVELVSTLVHRAQENARLNNLKNAHFRTMDLYKDVPYAKQMLSHEVREATLLCVCAIETDWF